MPISWNGKQIVLSLSALAWIAVTALLVVSSANAVSTRHFLLDDAQELAAGELEGTAVHSDGSVTLGAQVHRIELAETPVAYSFARRNDEVFVGTGNNGKIFRLRGDAVELFAETGQLLVSSLEFGSDGTLYAGTLPEGKIFAIDPQGGLRELVALEGSEHVWDLAWNAQRNTLFAATGPNGQVYAIDPRGRASLYYDSAATHIMSLALDSDGSLYVGTSDEAIVMRLRSANQSEVVFDFPGNEITALAVRNGLLAVAANEFPDPPRVTHASVSRTSTTRPARPRPGKGQLWRVRTDGRAEKIFENEEGHFTSVQLSDDETVFAGSGHEGRIFRVAPDRTSTTWIDVDERQVLAIDLVHESPLFLTGDTAAVYRVLGGRPANAIWTSDVLDADFRATFGQLTWRGRGVIEFQTRSGNTEEPNGSWSEWSAPMHSPGPIRSSAARFLQIRARFPADPDAHLLAVQAYYLPQNQRAAVHHVGLKPPGKNAKTRPADQPPPPSHTYELTWKVDNPDDDRLRYRVRFREESQPRFRPAFDEHVVLTEDEYEWNTSGVPDGWYIVQVEASDELANPRALTLQATAESEPLLVDNHPPRIEGLTFRGGAVVGRAIDGLGPILRLEYAVDGGDWNLFFPADGLLDTNDERIDLRLPPETPPRAIVAVRAYDAGGNSVTAELTLPN